MRGFELVELAATVAGHGAVLVQNGQRFSAAQMDDYWSISKQRLDAWQKVLLAFARAEKAGAAHPHGPPLRAVLEEVFAAEVLTRVVTALLCAADRAHDGKLVEPIARSILLGHLEVRNKALNLLLSSTQLPPRDAAAVNRLRRQAERWTDLLIGWLTGLRDVSDAAHEPARAREFGEDLNCSRLSAANSNAWTLLLASLRAAFQDTLKQPCPQAELNTQLAAAILAWFPAELFDSTGCFEGLWRMRLQRAAQDVAGLVDMLYEDCDPSPAAVAHGKPRRRP